MKSKTIEKIPSVNDLRSHGYIVKVRRRVHAKEDFNARISLMLHTDRKLTLHVADVSEKINQEYPDWRASHKKWFLYLMPPFIPSIPRNKFCHRVFFPVPIGNIWSQFY